MCAELRRSCAKRRTDCAKQRRVCAKLRSVWEKWRRVCAKWRTCWEKLRTVETFLRRGQTEAVPNDLKRRKYFLLCVQFEFLDGRAVSVAGMIVTVDNGAGGDVDSNVQGGIQAGWFYSKNRGIKPCVSKILK